MALLSNPADPSNGNDYVSEIQGLSPGAKGVLAGVHDQLVKGASLPSAIQSQPQPSPSLAIPPMGQSSGPTLGAAPRTAPPLAPMRPPTPVPTLGPAGQAHEAEFGRLTAVPTPGVHDSTQTGLSGIGQIHNPWARIPLQIADAVGSSFFPKVAAALPGTQLHHALLVNQAANEVAHDQGQLKDQADLAEKTAQTEHLNASASALENPVPKEEVEGRTITTDQGIMQWNPETKRYDISAGKAPTKNGGESKIETGADGTLYHVAPDGTASPVTVNGQPLKGKQPEAKEGNDFEQYYKQYLADNKIPDSAATRLKAEGQFSAAKQPPQRAPQITVMVPNGNGGYTATAIHPGQDVAPGAVTTAGMNSLDTPTSQTRTMAETAPKVIYLADKVSKLVDQQSESLGPAASRWNEFMSGKVGAPNAEFTKLRTDVGLLQTALMRMHVGARGGSDMMRHFQDLIDTSKQSPENLKDALGEITEYAKAVQKEGGAHLEATEKSGKSSLPSVASQSDFDKLPKGAHYLEDGREYIK